MHLRHLVYTYRWDAILIDAKDFYCVVEKHFYSISLRICSRAKGAVNTYRWDAILMDEEDFYCVVLRCSYSILVDSREVFLFFLPTQVSLNVVTCQVNFSQMKCV